MIFEPIAVFNVQAALTTAFISVIIRAAVDLIRGQGKEWEYYVGYGFGGGALTTGIPGAQAVMYAVGAGTVKLFFESSPGAAQARIFLDGVAEGDIDLDDEIIDVLEFLVNIPNDGQTHSLQILNLGTLELDNPTDWLALLAVETAGDTLLEPRRLIDMPYFTVAIRIKDDEESTKEATIPLNVPNDATVAEVQTWLDAVLPEIDALTEGQITEASLTLPLTLVGGLKGAPVDGAFNERGGLITFDTTGPRAASVRIPAISRTIMPGDTFPLTGDVADLVTRLTTETLTIRPVTEQDYQYTAARKGSKSLRK
jgi:hypothetical protein